MKSPLRNPQSESVQSTAQLATGLHTSRWLTISIVFHACILLTASGTLISIDCDDEPDFFACPFIPDYRPSLFEVSQRNGPLPESLSNPLESWGDELDEQTGFSISGDFDFLKLDCDFADVGDFDLRSAADSCNCSGGSGNMCYCGHEDCRCYAEISFTAHTLADWSKATGFMHGQCKCGGSRKCRSKCTGTCACPIE